MLTLLFVTPMCVQTVLALPVPKDGSLSTESTSAPHILCHPGLLFAVPAVGLAYLVTRRFRRKDAQPVQLEITVDEKIELYSHDSANSHDASHVHLDSPRESTPPLPSPSPIPEPLRKQSQVPGWFSQKGAVRSKPNFPLEGGIPIGEVVKSTS